jgi:hypothetical protein
MSPRSLWSFITGPSWTDLHALSLGAIEEKLSKPLVPGDAPARGGVAVSGGGTVSAEKHRGRLVVRVEVPEGEQ